MDRLEWKPYKIKPRLSIKAFRTCFEKYVPHGENTYFAGESHPFWEMVYITGGEWGVSADDRIYGLKEEQVIFHKPMEFHKIWKPLEEKASCFVCTFDLEGDSKYLEEKVFKVNHSQRELMNSLLTRIRGYSREELKKSFLLPEGEGQYLANTLENFFILLSEDARTVKTVSDNADAVLFNKAVNILKEHTNGQISVAKVASTCSVSVSKLNKLFAAYAGCGVHSYHIKLKINEAIQLMSKGFSSKEISDILGFNNQNYFSMTFKRETGFSPMNYKKQM